jgi:hypothetical protein
MAGKIRYVVLALKKKEADEVIKELRTDKNDRIANWLDQNKDSLYGEGREDWKPFLDGVSIRKVMESEPKDYQSATSLLDKIDEDATDVSVFYNNTIHLFVIDVFALYLKRYKNLAKAIQLDVAKTATSCLIMPYAISQDFKDTHDVLLNAYNKLWHTVYLSYTKGSLFRVLLRPDDIINFRLYFSNTISKENAPNLRRSDEADQKLGYAKRTETPRLRLT